MGYLDILTITEIAVLGIIAEYFKQNIDEVYYCGS